MARSEVKLQDDQPSVPDDLLADAHCLKCGYSLRGLPENRCPECGTAFDPAEFATPFVPEWPRLMTWYIAACVVISGLWLTATGITDLWYLAKGSFRSAWDALSYNSLPKMAHLAVILLAIPAIAGLRRRVDWGRKATVILLVAVAAVWLVSLTTNVIHMLKFMAVAAGRPDLRLVVFTEAAGDLIAAVVPSIVLGAILLTGLRCRSLRRSAADPHVSLPLSQARVRSDWPLLMVILMATYTATCLGNVVTYCSVCLTPNKGATWCFCHLIGELVVGLAFAASMPVVWRNPGRTSRTLRALFILSVIRGLALTALYLAHFRSLLPSYWMSDLGWGFTVISRLVIPAVLYVYASRALPAEAIELAANARTQPTHKRTQRDEAKKPDGGKGGR